jgi:hypothetical protein
MKRSILTIAVLAASVAAAPLAASEVKPVQPKTSTQGEVLGTLATQQLLLIGLAVAAAGVAISNSGSSPSTTPSQ